MFKEEKINKELEEIKQIRSEIKNPKIETEEKLLNEEESLEWLVDSINNKIHERIRAFFAEDDTRNVEDYNLNIDNLDGKVVLDFEKGGKIVYTESFKV